MKLALKKKSKNGRTPGIDGIPTEQYKADMDVAVKELKRLFNKMWHEETTTKARRFEREQKFA